MKLRTVCFAVLLVAVAAAFTAARAGLDEDIKAVLTRMKARAPQIAALKDANKAGETFRGLIEARKAVSGDEAKVIAAENADREKFFSLYARKTGKTVDVVRKNFAVFRFKKAAGSEYFKGANGKWMTKDEWLKAGQAGLFE